MFHKGLSRDAVVEAAVALVEEQGRERFSMRLLAERLGVKTASLYSHIDSMEALFTEIGLTALRRQRDAQLSAIRGLHGEDAVFALAGAYRTFAGEHPELYRVIMSLPSGNDAILVRAAAMVAEPATQVLADFSIDDTLRPHWQRVLRGIMHGFVSQEAAGFFSHMSGVDGNESYRIAVRCFLDGLHRAEEVCRNESDKK